MHLAKVRCSDGSIRVGVVEGPQLQLFAADITLSSVLHSGDPVAEATAQQNASTESVALADASLLPPIDYQEVWAAGVTYKRSKIAREEESIGAAQFYDKVYSADRPELFFKATPSRVSAPGGGVRIRTDGKWNVPEPEFTLVANPQMRIVGYTIGNDMSSRDIEGENPLYLPQAKVYKGSCAIGPMIRLAATLPTWNELDIRLVIERNGGTAFEGNTSTGMLNRTPESLIDWLGRDNEFPDGVLLLTGTGIVPPDLFTLEIGDIIHITISGIGTLTNQVVA